MTYLTVGDLGQVPATGRLSFMETVPYMFWKAGSPPSKQPAFGFEWQRKNVGTPSEMFQAAELSESPKLITLAPATPAPVSPDIVEMVGAIEDPAQKQADALRSKLGTMDPASAESAQLRQQLINVLAGVAPSLRNMLSWVEKKEDRAYINEIIKSYEMQAAAVIPSEPGKGKKIIKGVGIVAAIAVGLGAVWLLVSSLRRKL